MAVRKAGERVSNRSCSSSVSLARLSSTKNSYLKNDPDARAEESYWPRNEDEKGKPENRKDNVLGHGCADETIQITSIADGVCFETTAY